MVSDKQARNGGTQSGRALQDGESVLVAARRAAGDDDSWSERDSEAEGMSTDEVRVILGGQPVHPQCCRDLDGFAAGLPVKACQDTH
jgi:hypothetical protein